MHDISYSAALVPVRDDFAAAHTRFWRRLASPGAWWTGSERVAIAAEVRHARHCALCQARKAALTPVAVVGQHDHLRALSDPAVDVLHRAVTDAGRSPHAVRFKCGPLSAHGAGARPQRLCGRAQPHANGADCRPCISAAPVFLLNQCHSYLLRASSEHSGTAINLAALTDDEAATTSGVEHGTLLLTFAEAMLGEDEEALTHARHAVIEVMSPAALVDAAGVASNFERMVRIADATGIPLDARMQALSQEVRDVLHLERFTRYREME